MRILIHPITFSLLILFLCGCTTSQAPAPQKDSRQLTPITIAQYGHLFLYLPLYVALDKGYFADQGVDVKLISTGGDEKTFAAVSSGNAQFGVADPTFTAIARQHGQGGKVVASIVNGVPFWGIAFKPDIKRIDQPENLAGLRIATYSAPSTNYTVMKKILENNGKPIKATIVQGASTGSIVAMVKAGQADIAMELEPTASIAVSQGAHVVWTLHKLFGDFAITGLTVTDKYDERNGDTIRAVIKALAQAMRYIHRDFEGTIAVAKQEFPDVSEKILRIALTRMLNEDTIPSSPVMTKEAWDKAIALRRETGDLKGDGSFAANVDMQYTAPQQK
jgi:NitT/TauT family transport system substrate-binding protein